MEIECWNVLVNGDEQYGLFPAGQELPGGWRGAGFKGTEEACAEYVDRVWTDLRPVDLRRAMAREESVR